MDTGRENIKKTRVTDDLSAVTRLSIPTTHSQRVWIENIGTIESWSLYLGLVSDDIINIEKRTKRRQIITNVVLIRGLGIAMCWTRPIIDSRVIERREMKAKKNTGGPSPPSNHSCIL